MTSDNVRFEVCNFKGQSSRCFAFLHNVTARLQNTSGAKLQSVSSHEIRNKALRRCVHQPVSLYNILVVMQPLADLYCISGNLGYYGISGYYSEGQGLRGG